MDDVRTITETEALKAKLKATWLAGDFGEIAWSFEAGAVEFVARLGLRPRTQVLDVACGNGNTAIPAAKAGAEVTGIDIAPYLIEQATRRSSQANVRVTYDVGDAEDLPYEDDSFDAVISMFGAMFAPRPDVTIGEMKRVCRPGGLIAMANWTPEGFIGQMFKTTGRHVQPPAGMPSPLLWGDEAAVTERLGNDVARVETTRRTIVFDFPFGPEAVVEHFRQNYGPTQKAFEALDADARDARRKDLEDLWRANNKGDDEKTRVFSEYLEIKAIRV